MTATAISNSQDVIDSRDVIARIEELQDERQDLLDALEAAKKAHKGVTDAIDALADWDDDNKAELDALLALQEEAEGYAADWRHGETLIRDSYFEDYARQFAEDIGAIDPKASWPNDCIDWERAARELQMDYTSVDFDGVAYWIR